MRCRPRFRFFYYMLAAILVLRGGPSHAEILPWLVGVEDPWNSQKKIAGYGKNLRPSHCPSPPTNGQKLAMNDVVIAVLCNGTATRNAYLGLLSQADNYVAGYSAYLPSIDAISKTATYQTDYRGTSPNSVSSVSTRSTPSINASLLLYDFGQREATLDAAEQTLIASGYNYDSGLKNSIAGALNSYYNLLNAQKSLEVAKESARSSKEAYEAAELRYKLGLVPQVDKLQASVASSNAELGIQQAENALSQARARLGILIGLSPEVEFEVVDTKDIALAVDPFAGKVKELMALAKQKRSDLEEKRASLEAARISERAAKEKNKATLRASAGMNFNDLDVANNATVRSQSIGITLSIPIFNGFVDRYNERVTRRGIESQEASLKQAELEVEQDVYVAWQNYGTAKTSWQINQERLKTAQQARDIVLARYKEGLGNILDVLSAQQAYQSALQTHLAARYALLAARLELVRSVGVLNLNTINPEETADGTVPPPVEPAQSFIDSKGP